MKLKRKITKSDFEQLTDTHKALYVENGESYVLDIEDTAFSELKAEKEAVKKELDEYRAKEAERIEKAEKRALERAKEDYDKAKSNLDVDALEKSWQDKYAKLEQQYGAVESKYNSHVKKTLIDTTVFEMANKISTSPALITPHIRSRLDVDLSGDEPKLYVLDEHGQRSAQTVGELEKLFIDNKDFSAIIKATSASGGAKAGGSIVGSGAQPEQKLSLGKMSDEQLARYAETFATK